MSTWFGPVDALVKLRALSELSRTGGVQHVLADTVDMGRRAQVTTVMRDWSVKVELGSPDDLVSIAQIAGGYLGTGPFAFVSSDAPLTNLLTPDDAMCQTVPTGWFAAGPTTTPGGPWVARGLLNPGSLTGLEQVNTTPAPVIAGESVTGSMWLRGTGASITLTVYAPGGNPLQSVTSTQTVGADLVRVSVSVPVVPVGGVYATVFVQDAAAAYAPAITWSSDVLPWTDGRGCAAAVLDAGEVGSILLTQQARYESASFTVHEVS